MAGDAVRNLYESYRALSIEPSTIKPPKVNPGLRLNNLSPGEGKPFEVLEDNTGGTFLKFRRLSGEPQSPQQIPVDISIKGFSETALIGSRKDTSVLGLNSKV